METLSREKLIKIITEQAKQIITLEKEIERLTPRTFTDSTDRCWSNDDSFDSWFDDGMK